jgi:hypothetical protein
MAGGCDNVTNINTADLCIRVRPAPLCPDCIADEGYDVLHEAVRAIKG